MHLIHMIILLIFLYSLFLYIVGLNISYIQYVALMYYALDSYCYYVALLNRKIAHDFFCILLKLVRWSDCSLYVTIM